MPSSRVLVQVTLIALASSPAAWASDPPPDEGASPVRTEQSEHAVEVRVQGVGPTEDAARTDALRARDRALAEALAPRAHAHQLQAPDDGPPGTWPGEAVVDRVHPVGEGFAAELTWRVPDVGPLLERRSAGPVVLAARLQPRRGQVVLEVPVGMDGLQPGDVLLDGEGEDDPVALIAEQIALQKPITGERAGERQSFSTVMLVQRVRSHAPTCGPCCHGKDCRKKAWDP